MNHRDVSIIIFYDKEHNILLQDRKGLSKSGAEFGFFGGGIEKGETPKQAVIRETQEELSFDLKEFEYLGVVEHHDPKISRTFHVFIAPLGNNLSKFDQKEGKMMKMCSIAQARALKLFFLDHAVLDSLEKKFSMINIDDPDDVLYRLS